MTRDEERRMASLLGWTLGIFLFDTLTGAAVTFPLGLAPWMQYGLLAHTAAGIAWLWPFGRYCWLHWLQARDFHVRWRVWAGYASLATCGLSAATGLWAAAAAAFADRVPDAVRFGHMATSYLAAGVLAFHLWHGVRGMLRTGQAAAVRSLAVRGSLVCGGLACAVAAASLLYRPSEYHDGIPSGYSLRFGPNQFAPSNAMTSTGGILDAGRLSGSKRCGDCHQEIYKEWKASAHRWSSTDPFYQAVEGLMIKQMGQEATRYCAACHDPVALLSGASNPGARLDSPGSDEGSSCIVCHSIARLNGTTQGNGNYLLAPPREYLYEKAADPARREAGYFLVRAFPRAHKEDFSRDFHATPELCSACHKQFIDKEINNFGWVQLQNQYDDWRKGHYNVEGRPDKTLACKDCHMRLVASRDPARGQPGDPLRGGDGKHRSHRWIAANQAIPWRQGDREQARMTEGWLKGRADVPEIRGRWATGPAVPIRIEAPERARPGGLLRWSVVVTNNKVGHNFPTGPLDIIETWLEVKVEDARGRQLYHSGFLDAKNYVDKNAFFFRAIGVDTMGGVINRHNLWDMVGQKTKRAIFVGYSDAAPYQARLPADCRGPLTITARLRYRKFNQFIADFVMGAGKARFPVTDVSEDRLTVALPPPAARPSPGRRRDLKGLF